MFIERCGLIIWLKDAKPIRQLHRFGSLHYVSRRMQYAVLYVNEEEVEQTAQKLEELHFVKSVERSHRKEIPTEYSKEIPDKTRSYSV